MTREKTRVTYVTIPVVVTWTGHETYRVDGIDLSDDGDPGSWGNTYEWDPETEQGEWFFDPGAQAHAFDYVAGRLLKESKKCAGCGVWLSSHSAINYCDRCEGRV